MLVRYVALAVMLMLTSCDKPAPTDTAAATNSAAPAEDYLVRIARLPPAQQQLVLFRAVRDAGHDCQNVIRTERLADLDGRALWRITCRGGGQWAVTIGTDGLASVTGPPGGN